MGSTYVVEQHSFSIFPSNLAFEFDLILRSFLNFWGPNVFLGGPNGFCWGPNGLFWGWGRDQTMFWGLLM